VTIQKRLRHSTHAVSITTNASYNARKTSNPITGAVMTLAVFTLLAGFADKAKAQTPPTFNQLYYTEAVTIDSDIRGYNVIIGKTPVDGSAEHDDTIPTLYIVDIREGAQITDDDWHPYARGYRYGLFTYGLSQLNISGGNVATTVYANDNSLVNISGGSVNTAILEGNSTANISGGKVTNGVQVYNHGTLNISGGFVSSLWMSNDEYWYPNGGATVNMNGGAVDYTNIDADSVMNVTGGSLKNALVSSDGTLNISGGSVDFLQNGDDGGMFQNGDGIVNVTGGDVQFARVVADTVMNVSGGNLGGVSVGSTTGFTDHYGNHYEFYSNAIMNVSGGSVGNVNVNSAAHMNLSGGNIGSIYINEFATLQVTGNEIRVDTGSYTSGWLDPSGNVIGKRDYTLTGSLLDGSALNTKVTGGLTMASDTSASFAASQKVTDELFLTTDATVNQPIYARGSIGRNSDGSENANPQVTINDGLIGKLETYNQSQTVTQNAQFFDVNTHDNSVVNLQQSTVNHNVIARDNSIVNVQKSAINHDFIANDNAHLTITNCSAPENYGSVYSRDHSIVNISDSHLWNGALASGDSILNINRTAFASTNHVWGWPDTYGNVTSIDNSRVTLDSVGIDSLSAYGDSQLTYKNSYLGTFVDDRLSVPNGTVKVADRATLTLESDFIGGYAKAHDKSVLNIDDTMLYQNVYGYNNAIINVSGQSEINSVYINDDGILNLNGGNVRTYWQLDFAEAIANGRSQINMTGGSVQGYLTANDYSVININGGTVSGLYYNPGFLTAQNSGTINITGGTVYVYISANDSGTINISGGSITGSVLAQNNGIVNFRGGAFEGDMTAKDSGKFNLTGGTITGPVSVNNSGMINITGGNVTGSLSISDSGTVILTGGSINGDIALHSSSSSLLISGSNLNAVSQGTFHAFIDSTGNAYEQTDYTLSGSLLDSSMLNNKVTGYLENASDTKIAFSGGRLVSDNLYQTTDATLMQPVYAHAYIGRGSDGVTNTDPKVTLNGSAISTLDVYNKSQALAQDGQHFNVTSHDKSQIKMVNATIYGDIISADDSQMDVGGYAYGKASAHNNSVMNINMPYSEDTLKNGISSYDNATININSGSVNGDVNAYNQSQININSSVVYASTHDNSTVNINGGFVRCLTTAENSTVTIDDGILNSISTSGASIVNINSAKVNNLSALDNSTINVRNVSSFGFGTQLTDYGNSVVNLGEGTSISSASSYDNSTLNLSGANVDYISYKNNSIGNITGGSYTDMLSTYDSSRLSISGEAQINYFEFKGNSIVNMTGGKLAGNYWYSNVSNSSVFNLSGGSVGRLQVNESAVANILGGTIIGDLSSNGASRVNVKGGTVGSASASGGIMTISGGTVMGDALAGNGGVLNITGGVIKGKAGAGYYRASMNLSGGEVQGNVYASYSSIVNLSGGKIKGDVLGLDHGILNITGGTANGKVSARNFSAVNLYGGSFAYFSALNSGTINLYGTNLLANLIDSNYAFDGSTWSLYTLSGNFKDGTDVYGKNLFIQNGGKATYHITIIAPEPSSLPLALAGGLFLIPLLRKRKGFRAPRNFTVSGTN
jgi:hypothetical protein